jgi:hypothetical protein
MLPERSRTEIGRRTGEKNGLPLVVIAPKHCHIKKEVVHKGQRVMIFGVSFVATHRSIGTLPRTHFEIAKKKTNCPFES